MERCIVESKTFVVPAIDCAGCVRTVEKVVSSVAGVKSVKADETSKQVVVQWDAPASWQQISEALAEVDYPPA
jgi:copper chaperone CopZ